MKETIETILEEIGIPESATKIYVTLLREGDATARTLSLRTGITRTSVYDQLRMLRSKSLIVEREIEGRTLFAVSGTRQLSMLLDERVEQLTKKRNSLDSILESLVTRRQTAQPRIRFFEGDDGVRQLLKDILWYDDITLHVYWSYEDTLRFLGSEFLLWFNERRKKRRISIRTIWGTDPKADRGRESIFDDGADVKRRYFAGRNRSSMSSIIYGNKVAFISSSKEAFGFIVESEEFVQLHNMQFELLWEASKESPSLKRKTVSRESTE